MKFTLHFWGIFCCLCSYALSKNTYATPDAVSIGALFTFNSTIGRVAKVAMAAAVSDINNDSTILPGTKLDVQMKDSNCSGFVGIVQGNSSEFSFILPTMQIYVLITISSTCYNTESILCID